MSAPLDRANLASEADFRLGALNVSPSTCRVTHPGKEDLRVEAQTMAVLVMLARAGGATVSRDELITACWQGRIVSDDAVTRTIAKVRAVAKDVSPAPFVLETLPKVGYRLTAQDAAAAAAAAAETVAPAVGPAPISASSQPASGHTASGKSAQWRPLILVAGLSVAVLAAWALLPRQSEAGRAPGVVATAPEEAGLPTAAQVSEALILLDRKRVQDYLDRGWDPNWKLDAQGSNALQSLFMACERDPSHDSGMVAAIAQMLVKAGVDVTMRNKWDDSALDIAISPRYCGPHHPVVGYLKNMEPPEELKRVMTRACGEAFGGLPTHAKWAASGLTRAECAEFLGR